jgi:cell division protein ZapE
LVRPLQRYQADIAAGTHQEDPQQLAVLERLDQLWQDLIHYNAQRQKGRGWFGRLWSRRVKPPQGVYLWGGVGRGKTYLMDVFYESLPFAAKRRLHFHRFMQDIHHQLSLKKGQANPLERIADDLAQSYCVLCLDEFFVTDIGDAMLLGTLVQALFERGVVLVTTSNIVPSRLYQNGLQRERFIPAIRQLEAHTEVINLASAMDYRLRQLQQATLYLTPLSAQTEAQLREEFEHLVSDPAGIRYDGTIAVLGRKLKVRARAEDIVWFDFEAICGGPRSAHDYIEIAREFHAVVLSDIPQLGPEDDDRVRRFVHLVDEFYDRRVKLLISAAVPILQLYPEGQRRFEFERTESRLLEMQSADYLAAAHLS